MQLCIMEISAWFDKLPAKVQCLVRQNVQQWSVSALRQLTKVSHDLVKELVRSGKKTAAQVKKEFGSARAKEGENLIGSQGDEEEKVNDIATSLSLSLSRSQTPISDPSQEGERGRQEDGGKLNNIPPLPHSSTPPLLSAPELIPGMRIVVKEENTGWNGHSGIIMSKRQDDFWVLLDHTIAQGMEVKHLLKPHQIELENQQLIAKSTSQELFTAAQVEQKVASAISSISFVNAQYNREKAQLEQGRFVEIRDAALQAAKLEIQAAQEHAIALEQAKQKLIEHLAAKEDEVRSLQALQTRNQQLEQQGKSISIRLDTRTQKNLMYCQ
jgi:hypothetical protein